MEHQSHHSFTLENKLIINIPTDKVNDTEYFKSHRNFYLNSKGEGSDKLSNLDFQTFPFHQFYSQNTPTWFQLYEIIVSHNYFSPKDSQGWTFEFVKLNIKLTINSISSVTNNNFWYHFKGLFNQLVLVKNNNFDLFWGSTMNLCDIYQILSRLPGYEYISDLLIWNYAMTHDDLELLNSIISDQEFNQIVQRVINSSEFKEQFTIHDFVRFFQSGWFYKCDAKTKHILSDFIIERLDHFLNNNVISPSNRHFIKFHPYSHELLKWLLGSSQFTQHFWYAYIKIEDSVSLLLCHLMKLNNFDDFISDTLKPLFKNLLKNQSSLFLRMNDCDKDTFLQFLVHFLGIIEELQADVFFYSDKIIDEFVVLELFNKIYLKLQEPGLSPKFKNLLKINFKKLL
jgi:hypothetical protein